MDVPLTPIITLKAIKIKYKQGHNLKVALLSLYNSNIQVKQGKLNTW